MLINSLSANINDNCITFKDKHSHANITKELVNIKYFQISFNFLTIVKLFTEVAEHHAHGQYCHPKSKDTKVREEGISLNPTYRQRWNS